MKEKLPFDRNANATISMDSVAYIRVSFVFSSVRNVIRGNDVLNRSYERNDISFAARSELDVELDVNRATRPAKN